MSAIRVLFVNRMASLERGGGETFDLEISRHLANLGCRITFLSGWPVFGRMKDEGGRLKDEDALKQTEDRLVGAGHVKQMEDHRFTASISHQPSPITHVRLRSPYLPWFPWDKVKGGWRVRVWEFQQFEKKAARWIDAHRDEFDIIQICELPVLVSRLKSQISDLKSPLVMRLTAPNAHDPWGGIAKADALIASGTSIQKIRSTIRPDCHDIPNAVDAATFQERGLKSTAQTFRRDRGIPDDAIVCLYVARFQAFKNHAMLIDAFSRLPSNPSFHLILAGSGPLRQEMEDKVAAYGLKSRIHFLGEVAYDQLPRVYAASDIKVISSDYESFCFAALEGMAAGLPVVTTDCGWVPGLIGDTFAPIEKQWADQGSDPPGRFESGAPGERMRTSPGGVVVARNDAASLATALHRLGTDSSTREAKGLWNARKAEREHGWDRSARSLLALYERMLGVAP